MLTGLHFLLSYRCTFECDHCFVFSSPEADSTAFTLSQMEALLDEALKIGTIEWVYYEGGEVFMLYPLLMACIKAARARGFKVGIVTNSYFATDEENAALFLKPLCELGIADLSISDDAFHGMDGPDSPARIARRVAARLGLPVAAISIEPPRVEERATVSGEKGAPIVGGDVVFRGRAVEKLIGDLPRQPWDSFNECPYETLAAPGRVHIDPQGYVHLCQGLSMGNVWQMPLAELVAGYDVAANPVAAPIASGGPAALVRAYDLPHEAGYVQACHLCYLARRVLIERFPEVLAPRQMYGLNG